VIRYIGGLCRFVCSERVYSGSIILVYVEMYVEMYAQLVVGWIRVSTSWIRVSSTYTYARIHLSSTYTYARIHVSSIHVGVSIINVFCMDSTFVL
jgi:hypothetical protein